MVKVLDIMKEFGVRLSYLQSKYLPVIPSVAVHKKYNEPGRIIDDRFKRDLIKWLVYASFDKRYTGALERDLYQDISTLNEHSYEINHLLENLSTQNLSEGDLSGDREHLTLLSVLYTYNQARDWDIKADPTKISDIPDKELTVHHIFSYNVLKESGYSEEERNDFANITLISKQANTIIKDKDPSTYLKDLYEADPTLLKLHFIPEEEDLWRPEKYKDFLEHRRQQILEECHKLFVVASS